MMKIQFLCRNKPHYLIYFLDNLCNAKKIFEDENFKLYEDTNFYYLKFIQRTELIYGNHFFSKTINLRDLYFTYCFSENEPSGPWNSKIAYITNDRVFFAGPQEIKRFLFPQIISFKKNI